MRKYSLWLGLNSIPSFLAFLLLCGICHLYMKESFYLELVKPLQTIYLCINFILDNRVSSIREVSIWQFLCLFLLSVYFGMHTHYFGMYIQIHCLSKRISTFILLQRNGNRFHVKNPDLCFLYIKRILTQWFLVHVGNSKLEL